MRLNQRQLTSITGIEPPAPPPPPPPPAVPPELAARLDAIERAIELTRILTPMPAPPERYDDRALVARVEGLERAIVALLQSPNTFQFDIKRNDKGQIESVNVVRAASPHQGRGVWRKE